MQHSLEYNQATQNAFPGHSKDLPYLNLNIVNYDASPGIMDAFEQASNDVPSSICKDATPILEKGGRNLARSEAEGIAQKCKCDLVWCPRCFPQRHAPAHMEELRTFNWKHTREIVLTVNPLKFRDGREAHEYVTKNSKIHNLMRNIERGKRIYKANGRWVWLYKPIKIKKWKWFLEWYANGYPHWHLFVETEAKGAAGRIGGDRIRYYWPIADWIREDYIKSAAHWNNITGYFLKNGYFHKDKGYQARLPEWAQEIKGLRIRRSGSSIKKIKEEKSTFDKVADYFVRKGNECEIIDIKTGEIISPKKPKREMKQQTYKARLEKCGANTRVTIISHKSYIRGIFDIPYAELKKWAGGHFEARKGWVFMFKRKHILKLLDHLIHIEQVNLEADMYEVKARLDRWHEYHASQGFWHYMSHC